MKSESNYHTPALLQETIEYLNIQKGKLYVDATVGGGGHMVEIVKKGGQILGLDCDQEAVDASNKRLTALCDQRVCPLNAGSILKENFANLEKVMQKLSLGKATGILFDLGTSFHQLFAKGRGFSFQVDEELDMRLDQDLKVKAADLLQVLSAKELTFLFRKFGEEKYAQIIAKTIKSQKTPVQTTRQLAQICQEVYQKYHCQSLIHPATKIFQALRIAVNDELGCLEKGLYQAIDCLEPGGKLVVISFHGLEDKIVKNVFRESVPAVEILTQKPIIPGKSEIAGNPRSRSAKLRAIKKNA